MTDRNSTLLNAVQQLDPARGAAPVDGHALLQRVRTAIADAPAEMPDLAPHPVPRTRTRVALGAAAAVAVATTIALVSTMSSPTAYASWTATPTQIAPAEIADRVAACPQVEIQHNSTTDPDDVTRIPLDLMLAEQRGDYTFAVSVAENAYSLCLVGADPASAVANGASFPADVRIQAQDPRSVTVLNENVNWSARADEDAISYLVGIAGPEVTHIEVTTATGSFAEASIANGWWTVWFPGDVDLGPTLTLTLRSGAEEVVALTDVLLDTH